MHLASFHELRNSASFKRAWSTVQFPQSITNESALALQLIADCMLKQMVAYKAEALSATSKKYTILPELDAREKNAVRYMSGYVAVTLLKNTRSQQWIESAVDDYTRYWSVSYQW